MMSNSSREENPSFDDAVAAFRRFAEGQGFSPTFVWVFAEDISIRRGKVWIRRPVHHKSESLARVLYETARAEGRSATLCVLHRVNDGSACYVHLHGDVTAAPPEHAVGLCLNVPTGEVGCVEVMSPIRWHIRRIIHRLLGAKRVGCDVMSMQDAHAFIAKASQRLSIA